MRLKDVTVSVKDFHPDLWEQLWELDFFWRNEVGYELIITAGTDGEHSPRSRHHVGLAADIRTWVSASSRRQISGTRRTALLEAVRHVVRPNFKVLDKEYTINGKKQKTHFHIQMEKLT